VAGTGLNRRHQDSPRAGCRTNLARPARPASPVSSWPFIPSDPWNLQETASIPRPKGDVHLYLALGGMSLSTPSTGMLMLCSVLASFSTSRVSFCRACLAGTSAKSSSRRPPALASTDSVRPWCHGRRRPRRPVSRTWSFRTSRQRLASARGRGYRARPRLHRDLAWALPTGMVAVTVRLAKSTTETSLEPSLVT